MTIPEARRIVNSMGDSNVCYTTEEVKQALKIVNVIESSKEKVKKAHKKLKNEGYRMYDEGKLFGTRFYSHNDCDNHTIVTIDIYGEIHYKGDGVFKMLSSL